MVNCNQDRSGLQIVVPRIVVDRLEEPLKLSGQCIQNYQTVSVKVSAFTISPEASVVGDP